MRHRLRVQMVLAITLGAAVTALGMAGGKADKTARKWTFENVDIGKIPAGWKVEATNRKGPLAKWHVVEEEEAPSGTKVLVVRPPKHAFGGTFNLCWTDSVSFLDGEISVHFEALTGEEDQGGGVIWRVQDKDNYYISRANPLENNFRVYYVKNGARRMLASARLKLTFGRWYTLRIVHRGNRIRGYLDGKKLLEATDSTFPQPGGIGLWSKADAETAFDDLQIVPAK